MIKGSAKLDTQTGKIKGTIKTRDTKGGEKMNILAHSKQSLEKDRKGKKKRHCIKSISVNILACDHVCRDMR